MPKMPALFIGHGSPMNTLESNRYTQAWKQLGETLPRPTAILVISAHWYFGATAVTAMRRPRTSGARLLDGLPVDELLWPRYEHGSVTREPISASVESLQTAVRACIVEGLETGGSGLRVAPAMNY